MYNKTKHTCVWRLKSTNEYLDCYYCVHCLAEAQVVDDSIKFYERQSFKNA